jgi:hypothetical protein
MNLGQLTRDDDAKLRPKNRFQIGERIEQAVRSLIKDQGARGLMRLCGERGAFGEIFEARATRAGLLGQETEELKFVGGQARSDQRADGGVGAGNGKDGYTGSDGLANEPGAGIAHARRSGIGDERYGGPGLYALDQFGGTGALVVLVATDSFFLDLEMIEKFLGLARVFAGDAVDIAQNFKRAQRDIAQIADGSGDEVEAGGERLGRDSGAVHALVSLRRAFPPLPQRTRQGWGTQLT